jgi:hypothetical protein
VEAGRHDAEAQRHLRRLVRPPYRTHRCRPPGCRPTTACASGSSA